MHRGIDIAHINQKDYTKNGVRGYVCLAPEFFDRHGRKIVFSNWTEHGMCEMFEKRLNLKSYESH